MIAIPSLALNEIRKSFHGKNVLENISLVLEPGVYGLVGPNGAGKSTLIRIICGVLKADSGSMYWNGQKISQVPQFKEILGVMPQNQDGYGQFSGMEFLLYIACLKGINRKPPAPEFWLCLKKSV